MKVSFLGTGTSQGVPVIACNCPVCESTDPKDKRQRSSILVEWDELNFVIDTGPDFRRQMLDHKVESLDAVLYTHAHRDHVAGLDEIRSFNFKQGRSMPLYANSSTSSKIEKDFSYVFGANKYPGLPQVEFTEVGNDEFEVFGKKILPIKIHHYKLPILGFRFNDFTYITDAKTIDNQELEKIKGSRYLVLNALQKEQHISHLTLEEALAIIEIVQPEQALLTHISHNLGFHAEVEEELPTGVNLAYDGLEVEF